MQLFFNRLKSIQNVGFNEDVKYQGNRFLDSKGNFNVAKKGLGFWQHLSFYHEMIKMSWLSFMAWIIGAFLLMNMFFAFIYMYLGMEGLGGQIYYGTIIDSFWESFFFSCQTFSTVGYGAIHPIGFWHNIVASLEALIGQLALVIATGMAYARFSRPDAKISFSKTALISPYRNTNALMFRLGNKTNTQMIEAKIEVMFSAIVINDGVRKRQFYQLDLERDEVNFLALTWTIVHPIDEKSPLFNLSADDLKQLDAEFLVLFSGYDTSFSTTVYLKKSYKFYDLEWGKKFCNIFSIDSKGRTVVEFNRLSECEAIALNKPALKVQ